MQAEQNIEVVVFVSYSLLKWVVEFKVWKIYCFWLTEWTTGWSFDLKWFTPVIPETYCCRDVKASRPTWPSASRSKISRRLVSWPHCQLAQTLNHAQSINQSKACHLRYVDCSLTGNCCLLWAGINFLLLLITFGLERKWSYTVFL